MSTSSLRLRRLASLVATGLLGLAFTLGIPGGANVRGASTAPAGLTGIALDGRIDLAWKGVDGATSYRVYRGSTADTVTELVGSPEGSARRFTDTGVTEGATVFYAIRAVDAGGVSPASTLTRVTAVEANCNASRTIVAENCLPGTEGWKGGFIVPTEDAGIEGFTTAASINAGDSVGVKIDVGATTPPPDTRVEIYRNGWYGGDQGRLISVVPGLTGTDQPDCANNAQTGLHDCSNWSTSATISTTSSWPSGVYMVKFVREDNGHDNEVPLVVRNDDADPDLLYKLPVSTYQAYNFYGGKSLYDSFSEGPNTISGGRRAVEVSFDRPYVQSRSSLDWYSDWYGRTDLPLVSWLERQGYDVSYVTDLDVQASPSRLRDAKAIVNGIHDEYWTAEMRAAAEDARDAGVSLVFPGANGVYWRTRLAASPSTGAANRVIVCYKTTAGGPADPSGTPTGTWRDPAGANRPENALQGVQYVGDSGFAPLRVSAAEGRDRFWRHTAVADQAAGASRTVGDRLVGWEWDARADNGRDPAGLDTLASSPVAGNLLQDAGRVYSSGSTTTHVTRYRAPSGAFVWASGTNNWSTGLALNETGHGEPNSIIQQATLNLLTDMQVQPGTPSSGMVTEPPGPPVVTDTGPNDGATGVSTKTSPTVTFDRSIDPFTLNGSLTLLGPGGTPVEAAVSWDEATRTAKLDPNDQLDAFTNYTARLDTGVKGWSGEHLAASRTWNFGTGPGEPPEVASTTPANDATNVPVDIAVRVRFDRAVDPATLTSSSFSLRGPSGQPVTGTISYDAASRTARLTPEAPLSATTRYSARVTTAVRGADNTPLTAQADWSFTTGTTLDVIGRTPDPLGPYNASASPDTAVRAYFSRAVDPATLSTTSFQLLGSGGTPVPATVSYNAATRVGSLVPNTTLATATTYTARLSGVRAADGSPLAGTISWAFTTALTPPAAPMVSTRAPDEGAVDVDTRSAIRVTFDRALDPDSIDAQSFLLKDPSGQSVAATVAYESTTRTATLQPAAPLALDRVHAAELTTAVRGADGARLQTPARWSFRTARCPCTLYSDEAQPSRLGLDVRDGRGGSGPWSYELGSKITVSSPMELVALRYFRDPGETGGHTGRVWTSSGTELASATFRNESASGWQRQALEEPITLTPGSVYVISVGFNARFGFTSQGFATPLVNGPLSSATGTVNGVFGDAAGSFPTNSWASSSYFVDAVVRDPTGTPMTPHVSQISPVDGAPSVGPRDSVRAVFDVRMDASTIDGDSVLLTGPDGTRVPAAVAYDSASRTVTLDPAGSLELSTTYSTRLTNAIRSHDGSRLAQVIASFTTAATAPPEVDARTPDSGQENTPVDAAVRVRFDRSLDAATLTEESFSLRAASGAAVSAVRSYDAATRTAVLTPDASLAGSTTYTAELTTAIRGADGTAKSVTEAWSFRTGTPLDLTRRFPAALAGSVSSEVAVRAAFSKPVDVATLTSTTLRLTDSAGQAVSAAVSYNPATRVASLVPAVPLETAASYQVRIAGVRSTDGQTLMSPATWSFQTALVAPAAPQPTSISPADGATEVPASSTVRVRFDRPLDPDSLDDESVRIRAADGSIVAATRQYDAPSSTVSVRPSTSLALHRAYTVEVATTVRSAEGARLSSPLAWGFTSGGCPCSLWSDQDSPAQTKLPTRDGRTGTGLDSYELGTRITVDQPTELVALRYWRDELETGNHVGRVWSEGGTLLASASFAGESGSGWQRQRLATPLALQPGQTYVLSVGVNTSYGMTRFGLDSPLQTGPLRSVAGTANGVFADAAGSFPSQSWSASAYYVDGVVRVPAETRQVPGVSSRSPLDGASGVAFDTEVAATFSVPLDPTTVTPGSFTLRAAGAGADVPATVLYDDDTRTARLRPSSPLHASTTYTARLSTAIRSGDDTPMTAADSWSFVTAGAAPPAVTATSPVSGSTSAPTGSPVTATFSQAIDPATIDGATFSLQGPAGAVAAGVSYDATTRTAILQPTSALAGGASYTASLSTGVASAVGVPLPGPVTWSFTTQACPCSLLGGNPSPSVPHLDVADGRGAGDWSYELGLKFEVRSPIPLTAIRFHKDADEAGTHIGRLWTADGTLRAQTTFTGETASGWQQQAFASPVTLVPGQVYVASVSFNDYFGMSPGVFEQRIDSGPLSSVADGSNGVYAPAAGVFPTGSWSSSSYLVDVVTG